MLLGIYAAGVLALRGVDWYRRPGLLGYGVMAAAGLLLAVALEVHALRTGRWAYTTAMPTLPLLGGIGFVPMLQMIVLPPVIFKAAAALERATPISV